MIPNLLFSLLIHYDFTPEDVKKYDKQTDTKGLIIFFYEPWCYHCRNQKPLFDEAARYYKDNQNIITGSVNCDEHSQFCKDFGAESYPTYYIKYKNQSKFQNLRGMIEDQYDLIDSLYEKIFGTRINIIDVSNAKHVKYPCFIGIDTLGRKETLHNTRILCRSYIGINFYWYSSEENLFSTYKYCDGPYSCNNITDDRIPYVKAKSLIPIHNYVKQWSIDTLMEFDKPFSIFVIKDPMDAELFRKLIRYYSNVTLWGSAREVGLENVKEAFDLSDRDLPAVVLYNSTINGYRSLKNIKKHQDYYRLYLESHLTSVLWNALYAIESKDHTVFNISVSLLAASCISGYILSLLYRKFLSPEKQD